MPLSHGTSAKAEGDSGFWDAPAGGEEFIAYIIVNKLATVTGFQNEFGNIERILDLHGLIGVGMAEFFGAILYFVARKKRSD